MAQKKPLRISIIGAGPAGLYTAILARQHLGDAVIEVIEQNPKGATFGFGVVFSDKALDFLSAGDPQTVADLDPWMERWDNMTLNHPNGRVVLDGIGFSAIGRLKLLQLLEARAADLGVNITYDRAIDDPDKLKADVIIGADGLNSVVRRANEAGFSSTIDHFTNHFAWFGSDAVFDTLTQSFIHTEHGPMNAHHYRYAPDRSTFIVECGPQTWATHGFDTMDEDDSAARCADLFSDVLGGARLVTNKSAWRVFPRLWCARWVAGRQVILGDAAHTSHFSIGSGTRLAMEDAIALVQALAAHEDVPTALAAYQDARLPVARKIVTAANTSARWYDDFGAHMQLPPLDFAYGYLTRSGRMTLARARRLAPAFMAEYDAATLAATQDQVPASLPGSDAIGFDRAAHANCSAILWDNLQRNPHKLAIICKTGIGEMGDVTYAELIVQAAQWGNAFIAAGLQRGDRIPFFLDDTPSYPAAFFGAVRAGFVPVLLNTQTNADTLSYFLGDTEARIVLCEAAFLSSFPPDMLARSSVEKLVVVNGDADEDGHISQQDFLADQPLTLDCADTTPGDMAFWMYSSGTTGRPKGIVHLHHDMAYTQQSYGRQVLGITADDICFSVPKIFFAYGFGNSITFPFSVGATSVLLPGRPDPATIFDTIERCRPSLFFGLPTLYTALCSTDGAGARDLSSIRRSVSAAETLSQDIYDAWKGLCGHGPTEGLGSTELLHIYLSNHPDDHRVGAAGAPVLGYEVQLQRPDGSPAPPGEDGVMLVRGDSSTPCYWRRADKTAETMRDGWIYTGDRFIERDGYYYFQGRADDLIKVSGQWVWPLEIERCLNENDDVTECAVLAHQLADGRMTLRAVVALRDGMPGNDATTRRLQDFVRGELMPFKYPRIVEYTASLPKTGTGKIDRQALQKDSPQNSEMVA